MKNEMYKRYSLNFYEEDKEIYDWLHKQAKAERRTLNGFILKILDEYKKQNEESGVDE